MEITVAASDNPQQHPNPTLEWRESYWLGQCSAMASPCSVLIEGATEATACEIVRSTAIEAWRIEHKFSRYAVDNPIYRINHSQSQPINVDEETARLLDYADQCHRLSNGLFDITSGVLRRAWRFDGSDRLPSADSVKALLPLIGWKKVHWQPPELTVPESMELDLGGIGKEYAVDRCLQIAEQHLPDTSGSVLINFGGDLACSGPRISGQGWTVGIEDNHNTQQALQALTLRQGALATSGDSRRFLIKNGIRYGHILNPFTGWSVADAPHSVTVAAPTCTLAGMLATFAMLQGADAESFLDGQGVTYWVQRD